MTKGISSDDVNQNLTKVVEDLTMQLKMKDEEISQLKSMIAAECGGNDGAAVHSARNAAEISVAIDDVTKASTTATKYTISNVETIFHGNDRQKPNINDVVKIHYTIHARLISVDNRNDVDDENKNKRDLLLVEDSRERRKGIPFEFVLGCDQIHQAWESIIIEMNRGEVTSATIIFQSDDCPAMITRKIKLSSSSNEMADKIECISRIELIGYWAYDEPFRPWIVNEDFGEH